MDSPVQENESQLSRCPSCDSVISSGSQQCLMCGQSIDWPIEDEKAEVKATVSFDDLKNRFGG